MTNAEAIEILSRPRSMKNVPDDIMEAHEMAIKSLEQQTCKDAVSREAALKECHDIVVDGERYSVIQEETLLGLPPVKPQEPCEDAVSRQMVKEIMIKYGFHAPDMTVTEFIEDLPPFNSQTKTTVCENAVSREAVKDKLLKLCNGLEGIFANIRMENQDESVCGLCEYDCPAPYECPGFDKEDCFKLADEIRHKWQSTKDLPPVKPQYTDDEIQKMQELEQAEIQKAYELGKSETGQFAKWVATEIFDDNWEYNKDAFAELACRKLAKIGIVRAKGDKWELVEPQESENTDEDSD